MKKVNLLLKIILPLFLIAFMGFYLFWQTVPSRMTKILTNSFQTPVFIGDASFGLYDLAFRKIIISSPKGSSLPQAFSCSKLSIDAWITNYLKKDIVIDLIELDNVYLGLEFDSASGTTGNWTRLMNNLSQNSSQRSASNKTVLIKKLIIRNISTQVFYASSSKKPINLKPIDKLEFDNISSTDGFPVEQLSSSVLGKMLKQVFVQQNLQDMLNKWIQPQQQIPSYMNPFKLF